MGSSGVSKPDSDGQSSQKISGLPTQLPESLVKAYPESHMPGIKKWFNQMFPSLGGKQLAQAMAQFMLIQTQFMQHFMSKLKKQRQKVLKQLRRSEKGE